MDADGEAVIARHPWRNGVHLQGYAQTFRTE
jgi:hypothetical protein